MKPQLLKRNRKDYLESISFQHVVNRHFLDLWHYHPEFELVYIVRSSGNCFIGDAIERFEPGTLMLLGSNLPHGWFNKPKYFKEASKLKAESLAIHFSMDFMQVNLKNIPEFQQISHLMERSKVGLLFGKATQEQAYRLLVEMTNQDAFNRLLSFLQILRCLSEAEDYRTLSSAGYVKMFRETNDRLGRVHEYIMNNFNRDISLTDVADIALMNKSAFCRYFKKATKKSFSQYLNEIRIGYACKLLQERTDATISEIAFEIGYNNLSNFNRQFKIITGYAPTTYLRCLRQNQF
jgi:AraC-like DNA-binding protein